MTDALYLGIDVGTSGVRALAIDAAGRSQGSAEAPMPPPRRDGARIEQDPAIWWEAVSGLLRRLGPGLLARVRRLAVDGTSGTLLLIDEAGRPKGPALLYNDARGGKAAERIAAVAPPESGAHGATSALARLMTLQADGLEPGLRAVHQADWIAGCLAGRHGRSDENNALKTGYDPVTRRWPDWIASLGVPESLLPAVEVPGTPLGRVALDLATRFGFPPEAEVCAGTTDGVAAFLAAGAVEPGDAVTSLGSTLVVKLLAERPVFDPACGVYSHRLGERWLVGGASNSGGAALLQHFTAERLQALSAELEPDRPTGLDYYPLPSKGERFPLRDPELASRVEPRPAEDARFLQGLLEGVARIETLAYGRLAELGAPALRRVLTVGGGAQNPAWTRIRARLLGVPVTVAGATEAAYGTALLARWEGPPQ